MTTATKPLRMTPAVAPLEWEGQAALFEMIDKMKAQYPQLKLVFAIPNGQALKGFTSKKGVRVCPEGSKWKAMGVRPGVPDIFVCVWRPFWIEEGDVHHGLYIKMKRKGEKPREEQEAMHTLLRNEGYRVEVCDSWYKAWDLIVGYLGLPEELLSK